MKESNLPIQSHRTALMTVFLAVLIDLMGFGIVLPLLPFYASNFHATPIQIGLLYSIFSFAQLIFSPIWGSLSDHFGRRPVMLISTFGAVIAYTVFAFANSLALLFISRLIAGIMGGNISTAQAYVADVTTHEDRAKGMGLIGAAFGIGFVMGPALASALIHPKFLDLMNIHTKYKFLVPGIFAAILSLSSFLLVLFKLPETIQKSRNKQRVIRSGVFSKSFWNMIFETRTKEGKHFFALLIFSMFLLAFSQATLYSSFPLFCNLNLNFPAEHVGILFVYMGLIAILIQGGLIKILTKNFGETPLFLTGNILLMAGLFLIPFSRSMTDLLFFLGILSVGGSLNMPTLNSLISKEVKPDQYGSALGTAQGMGSLGRVIGPTWGGFLYHYNYHLPFLLTACLISLAIYVGFKLISSHA